MVRHRKACRYCKGSHFTKTAFLKCKRANGPMEKW